MGLALSTKPWSAYSEADYTVEQWHAACLIHQHSGPPTSKQDCKLPVKTPSGALNREGCIAAAGALAGARTPLKASSEEKSSAAKALIRYYGQFNMKPTPKMMSLAHSEDVSGVLSHYGVLGMKWGVRRARSNTAAVTVTTKNTPAGTVLKTKGGERLPAHPDAVAARVIQQKLKKSGKNAVSNQELQQLALRLNLENQVTKLNGSGSGKKFVADLIASVGKQQVSRVANDAAAKKVSALLKKS